MNYWQRHIGDYTRDAGHLSMLEDGAYTRLLDRFYSTEEAIPADKVHRLCRASSDEERAAVDAVLAEFWTLTETGWVNRRAMEELQAARKRIASAQENGKKGGRPSKSRPEGTQEEPGANPTETQSVPSGMPVGKGSGTQGKAHQSPITNHQPSVPNGTGAEAPSARDVVFAVGVPMLTAAGTSEKQARSFLALQSRTHGDAAVAEAIQQCAAAQAIEPLSWLTKMLGKPGRATEAPKSFRERDAELARQEAAKWMGSYARQNVIDLEDIEDARTPRLAAG